MNKENITNTDNSTTNNTSKLLEMKTIFTFNKALRNLFLLCILQLSLTSLSAADFYWVGGSGDWTDLTHWATTSGGATNHTIVPSPLDKVIFDANSGLDGGTVVMNFEAFCNDFEVSVIAASGITFDFNAGFNAFNSVVVAGNVNWTQVDKIRIGSGGLNFGPNVIMSAPSVVTTVDGGGMSLGDNNTWIQNGDPITVTAGDFTVGAGSTVTLNQVHVNLVDGDLNVNDGATYTMNKNSNNNTNNLILSSGALLIGDNATFEHWGDVPAYSISDSLVIGNHSFYYDHRGNTSIGMGVRVGHHSTFRDNHRHLDINGGGFIVDSLSTIDIEHDANWRIRIEGNMILGAGVDAYFNKDIYINNGSFTIGDNATFVQPNGDFIADQGSFNLGSNTSLTTNGGTFRFGQGDLEIPSGSTFSSNTGGKQMTSGGLIAQAGSTVVMNGSWILLQDGGIDINPTSTYTGSSYYRMFTTATANYTVRTSGNDIRLLYLEGGNHDAEYHLVDDFTAKTGNADWGIWAYRNKFFSDGFKIDVNALRVGNGSVSTFDLSGTDTIFLANEFTVTSSANQTLEIDDIVFSYESTANQSFNGGNRTFDNDINILAQNTAVSNISFSGNNTYNKPINITANGDQNISFGSSATVDSVQINYTKTSSSMNVPVISLSNQTISYFDLNSTIGIRPVFRTSANNNITELDLGDASDLSYIRQWEIGAGTTQTIGSISGLTGTCPRSILINSTTLGSVGTINVASGTVSGDYLRLQDNVATGGATFNASNTLDFGNVTGWNFTAVTAQNFYWIGNSTNWNDPNAWSFSSGGAVAGCVPTRVDNVFFDDNSFTGSGQFCTANTLAECHNMTWESNIEPGAGLNGAFDVLIFGSLELADGMNFAHSGDFIFESFAGNETIETHGVDMRDLRFRAQSQPGGEWSLVDSLTINGSFILERGVFNTFTSLANGSVNEFRVGNSTISGNFNSNGENIILGSTTLSAGDTMNITGGNLSVFNDFYVYGVVDSDGGDIYVQSRFDINGGGARVFAGGGNLTVQGFIFYILGGGIFDQEGGNGTITVPSQWTQVNGVGSQLLSGGGDIYFSDFYPRNHGLFKSNGAEISVRDWYNDQDHATIDLLGTSLVSIRNRFLNFRASTNLILDTPTTGEAGVKTNFEVTSGNHHDFNLANHTFNNLTLNYTSNSTHRFYMSGNNQVDTILVNSVGRGDFYLDGGSTIDYLNIDYTNTTNTANPNIFIRNAGNNINSFVVDGEDLLRPQVRMQASGNYGSVILNDVLNWRFWPPGNVFTIGDITITGDCDKPTIVRGETVGNASTVNVSGTTNMDGVILIDLNSSASTGSLIASNSVDGGNVSGWTISGGSDLFWIGNSGNWNDGNNWSYSSGGTPAGCIPNRGDNVFFDVNSFSAANQTVNVNINAEFNNMVWNGVNFPILGGGSQLHSYGSLLLDPNMTWNASNSIFFQSRDAGNTINTNGVAVNNMQFTSSGTYTGEWILQNDLDIKFDIYVQNGTLISNGHNLSARSFFNTNNNSNTTINFTGSAILDLQHRFEVGTNTNIIIDDMDITWNNLTSGFYRFYGGNHAYNDLTFNHGTGNNNIQLNGNNSVNNLTINTLGNPNITVDGNSTWNDITFLFDNPSTNVPNVTFSGQNTANVLSITSTGSAGPFISLSSNNSFEDLIAAGVGTRLILGVGSTQTVNGLISLGSGSFPVFVKTTSDDIGQTATIYKPSGEVCLDFVLLQNIIASGDSDGMGGILTEYFAGASSVDLTGNSANWQFTSCGAYYWVGDSGDWSDFSGHWATSSGGTAFHASVPGPDDNVFFDANSFTAPGQVVNIDVATAEMKNMSWQSALFTPTLSGSSSNQADVYGDLDMITTMVQSFDGTWNFKAADLGHTINTAGNSLEDVNILGGNDGEGEWTLVNALNVQNDINFQNGTLITDDKNISATNFNVTAAMTQSLNLGSSTVSIINGTWNPAELDNSELIEGNSTIEIKGEGGSSTFNGFDLTYNDVTFTTDSDLDGSINGSNTINTLTIDLGLSLTIEAGSTQSTNSIIANGTCDNLTEIASSIPGTASNFTQSSGTNDLFFVDLSDNAASGGATFNANNSIDNGGNSGWNFLSLPATLIATLSTTDVDCTTNNDGTATVDTVIGGTAPYSYVWSTTATTATIENLIPGIYSVTISDATGCFTEETSAVVNEASGITETPFTASATDICLGIQIDFTAGSPPEAVNSYLWDFGDFNSSTLQDPSHTYSANGVYIVSLSYIDVGGCPSIVYDTISVSDLEATIESTNILCFGENNGTLDITATSGIEPYQYSIDNGTTYSSTSSYTGLSDGTYQIKVIDANNCETGTIVVSITEPSSAVSGTITQVNNSCSANEDGEIHVVGSGGTGPYQYSINNGIAYLNSGDFIELPFGTYNVIVRDANLCVTSAQIINLVVEDMEDPTIICPGNESVIAALGSCDAAVTVGSPTVDDNCGVASVTNDYNGLADASDIYPSGTTNIEWTVTDINGRTSTCVSTVTVNESTPPTITCAADTVVNNELGLCSATIVLNPPTTSDNCSTANVTNDAPTTFPVGSTPVTWTAMDAAGNTATCVQNVTVVDAEAPTISCISNQSLNLDGNCEAIVPDFTALISASDNCSVDITQTPAAGTSVGLGSITVTLTATDPTNMSVDCVFDLLINDSSAPMISCPTNVTVSTDAGVCEASGVVIGTATATDNCNMSIATSNNAPLVYPLGVTEVVWYANDGNGNQDSCIQTVLVEDNEAPTFACQSDLIDSTDVDLCTGFVSWDILNDLLPADNCNIGSATVDLGLGEGPVAVTDPNDVIFSSGDFPIGTTSVSYVIYDDNNNSASCSFDVIISDNEAPMAICQDITVNLDAALSASVTAADLNNNSSDNCDNDLSFTIISGQTSYNCDDIGQSYAVTLEVEDDTGNISTCISMVTVTDTNSECCAAPNAICASTTVSFNGASSITIAPSDIDAGSTAECGLVSMTVSPNEFFCSDYVGSNETVTDVTVTLTVEDVNGAISTCNAVVSIINDDTPPVFNCPVSITINNDPNQCGAIANFDVTATDACSNVTINQTEGLASGSEFPVGVTINTFEANDDDNNVSVCSFSVTVVDVEPPVASCQDITIELGSAGPGTLSDSDISGVINTYGAITAVGVNNVSLTSIAGFSINDKVIIMQMDGATIDQSNSASFGDISTLNNAGSFEYARIQSIAGTTITFVSPIVNSYDATAKIQLIRVPEYNNVTISGNLTAADWNGTIGGVLAFDAQGTVTMNADIDMNGKGFRGGLRSNNYYNGCENYTDYFTTSPSNRAGEKGEGITDLGSSFKSGRGKYANAGGGGGSVNSGGGGGANFGSGGQGGREYVGCNLPLGGLGGLSLSPYYLNGKVYLGGAGGGGQQNNSVSTNGADGGGIVLIAANEIEGNGYNISAKGNNGINAANDGAGGGGAGGAILLTVDAVNSTLNIQIDGGSGGNATSGHGPAGGGGGGAFWHSGSVLPTNILVSSNGGANGTAAGDPFGTSPGLSGGTLSDLMVLGITDISTSTILLTDVDAGSTDNCDIASISLSQTEFGCEDLGVVDVVLTVTDVNGLSSTCAATVTVEDNTTPSIICPSNITVSTDLGSCEATNVDLGIASVSDNCTMNIVPSNNAPAVYPLGLTQVMWIADDGNGNQDTCFQTVFVEDTEAPMAICQDITLQLDASGYVAINASMINNGSSDACGIDSLIIDIDSLACDEVGLNEISLRVVDVNGNESFCISTVTVEDNIDPVAICQDITIYLDAAGNATIEADDVDNGSDDACRIDSLSINHSNFDCASLGANTVILTAVDEYGNSSTCISTVTVLDSISPVISCTDITVQLNSDGNASITQSDINGGTSDACGIDSEIINMSSFDCSMIGNNSVTLTVTDNNGNSSECAANVVVEDNVDPLAICQDVTVHLDASGNASILAGAIDNGSNDACGIAGIVLDDYDFDCNDVVGGAPVQMTVTDNNGNMSTCSANVTVLDTIAPIAVCQDITIQLDSTGNITITESMIDAGSADACGIASISLDITEFSCVNVGSNTVILTVIDNNGNISNCTSTVTVEDLIDPVAMCQDITIQLNASGEATITASDIDAGSTDACGVSLSIDIDSFDCSNIGPNMVTLTLTDDNNNVSTCISTVTVEDNIDPIALCQNITVQLDATGNVSISELDIDAGSNDACGIASLVIDVDTFNCTNIGVNTVILTVTDVNNNISTCSSIVTVEDNVDPVALCQNLTIDLDAQGSATITPDMVDNGSNDACGIESILLDKTTFDCSEIGANTVILKVKDFNGNESTCTSTITIVDLVTPIAICQDITVSLDENGTITVVPADVDNGSNDACGIDTLALNILDFDCSNIGDNDVILTVTDENGNVSTCSSTITVVDDELPTFSYCPDDQVLNSVEGDCSALTSWLIPVFDDNCGISTSTFTAPGVNIQNLTTVAIGLFPVGTTTVTMTVTDDNGNSVLCTFDITVNDVEAPEITNCPGDIEVDSDEGLCSADVMYGIISASDNCSGVIFDAVSGHSIEGEVFPVGTTAVEFLATDDSGNSTQCNFNVIVNDVELPTLVCQDITIDLDSNGNASILNTDVFVSASDNCGIDSTSLSIDVSTFDCANVGANIVVVSISDIHGNVETCTATVTVEDNVEPEVACKDITVYLDNDGLVSIEANDIIDSVSDACGIATMVIDSMDFDCSNFGVNTVNLTITDNNGNISTCSSNVTVDDAIFPTLTCPDDITVFTDPGTCEAIVDYEAISTDNCSADINYSIDPMSSFSVGSMTVSVTSTDLAGNMRVCLFVVTVIDNELPEITCPDDITLSADEGACEATGFALDAPVVSDACGIANITSDAQTSYPVGINSVTYTATDANGNSVSCTQMITVEDNEAPMVTCNDITIDLPNRNDYVLSNTDIDAIAAGSSDNCGNINYSITAGTTTYNCDDKDQNFIVTLTVVDDAGNTNTCEATVTIIDSQSVCNDPPMALCQDVTIYTGSNCDATVTAEQVDGGSTDPDGDDLILTLNNYGPFGVGVHSVYLITSDGEFQDSCSAMITVQDTTAPIAICQDITIQLDSTGNAGINANLINNGSSDACGVQIISIDNNSFNCSNVGANTVILTVIDVNGNEATCSSTVTVEDVDAPVALCQDITVQLDANGDATISAEMIDNGSNDICGIQSMTLDKSNFDCTDVGTVDVVLTVTDNNNNVSKCSSTVTVEDNVSPEAICQNIIVDLDEFGEATINVSQIDDGSTDACGIQNMTLDITSFDCTNIGDNTVTLTVEDANGNVETCTSIVTVNDEIAPVAICQDITVELDANGLASIVAGDIDNGSNDACGIQSLEIDVTDFDCSDVGSNGTINSTAVDFDGSNDRIDLGTSVMPTGSYTKEVWVIAHSASCKNILSAANGHQLWLIGKLSAGHSTSYGIVQEATSFPLNSWQHVAVSYDAATGEMKLYRNGNLVDSAVTSIQQISTVNTQIGSHNGCVFDGEMDEVRIWNVVRSQSDIMANMNSTLSGTESGLQAYYPLEDGVGSTLASDLSGNGFDGILSAMDPATDWITSTAPVSGGSSGVPVSLTVTDNNGNVSTCQALVTVEDNIAPEVICQDITVQLDDNGDVMITPEMVDNGSNDACGIESLSLDMTSFTCNSEGVNVVTLTVTDVNGNSSNCTSNVTVEDNVAPIAICQDLTIQLDLNGSASITASEVDNGSNDACGIASLELNTTDFSCFHVGENSVTLTVTDNNGNESECSSIVTVEDNVAPIAICQDLTIQLDVNGEANITSEDINNGSNDACGIQSLEIDLTNFDCTNVGDNTVTLTVTDNYNNTSVCTSTVTVEDMVNPVVICQNITVQLDDSGQASIIASDVDGGSNDACNIATLTIDVDSFNCSNVGLNTVVLTAIDENGNASSCEATVNVEDSVEPIAICQDITIQLDVNGEASIVAADINNGSNDACGIQSMVVSLEDFDCRHVGDNVVTLTITDSNNNVSTCTSTVTVEDNVAPQTICQDITVQLDGNGNVTISAADVDNGSNDACGIESMDIDITEFDCNQVGVNIVTLSITDNNGNNAQCTSNVTVEDNVAPIAICQDITVQLDTDGMVTISASDVDGGSNDACGIESLAIDVANFNCNDVGNNQVSLTVTDVNGNTSICQATVTVQDMVDPIIITGASDLTVECDGDGNMSALNAWLVSNAQATATDACGVTWTNDFASLSNDCGETGLAFVTFTATDDNGNTTSTTATFTIEDTTAPNITCGSDVSTCADQTMITSSIVTWIEPTFDDVCGSVTIISTHASGDIFNVGTTTVTYTATDDCGNSAECSFDVTVFELPEVNITESENSVYCQGDYKLLTANTSSNVGGITYLWSNGDTSETTEVSTSGTYSVVITDSNNCTRTTSYTVVVNADDLLSAYTILAQEEVHLNNENFVFEGGVGVYGIGEKAKINGWSSVSGTSTFVKADIIQITGGSVVDNPISDPVNLALPAFLNNPHSSSNDVNVPNNATVTLSDDVYGHVYIGKNATVTFTEKDIFIEELDVRDDATIEFASCAFVRVAHYMDIDKRVVINSTGAQVSFFAGCDVSIKQGSQINANINAQGQHMHVQGHHSTPTIMEGQFIANRVHGNNYVEWYRSDVCDPACQPEEVEVPCDAHATDSSEEWIESITVNGTTNQSGNDGGYGDYTSVVLPLTTGTNSISLVPGYAGQSFSEYWTVFIDLNDDGDYIDAGEFIASGSGVGTLTGNINIPNYAAANTTMRVIMSYHCFQNPCDVFQYGEVEDYSVSIDFCYNLVDGGNVGSNQVLCGDMNDPEEITENVAPSGGSGDLEYVWLVSTTTNIPPVVGGMNGWTEVPNSNFPTLDPDPITESTWYLRCARRAGCIEYTGESNVVELIYNASCTIEYCDSEGQNTDYEWIQKVSVGDIDNNSGNDYGYGDYTFLNTTMNPGAAYPISLKPGFSGSKYREYWRVWIDWNQDGDFNDAGEKEVQKSSKNTVNKWITVPSNALPGATRMRVSMRYGGYAWPCEDFSYGEVEDYTIFVGSGSLTDEVVETREDNKFDEDESFDLEMSIYPNPAHDNVKISLDGLTEGTITIFDQLGQVALTKQLDGAREWKFSAQAQNLSAGVYRVTIESQGSQISKPLIIVR